MSDIIIFLRRADVIVKSPFHVDNVGLKNDVKYLHINIKSFETFGSWLLLELTLETQFNCGI